MDELRQQVADLEIQEADIERQLGNAETDEEARQITNDLNLVRNRLSEKREELRIAEEKEQVRAEVIEEKVHAEEIPLAIAGIDFTELPAEVITLIDAVVKADRRRLLNEHAVELEQAEEATKAAESREWELTKQLGSLDSDYRSLVERNQKQHEYQANIEAELEEAKTTIGDLHSKLANAVAQIEEKDAEINRLNTQVEDLKRAQEYNNRQTEKFNANDDEKATINAALEAVKKLYVKVEDYGSIMKVTKPDGTFELAKRQEVAEEWSPVDVPSFRPEDPDANPSSDQLYITETSTAVEPPAFREEEPTVQDDVLLREGTAEDASPVSRAEFEARMTNVEKGMETLMRKVFGEVAA